MAKVKVYELAKELDKQSKDILTFLADKGVEVKSHMSVLEEDVAEMVKSAFSGTQTAKPEKKEEAREAAVKGTEKKEESQTEQARERGLLTLEQEQELFLFFWKQKMKETGEKRLRRKKT